MEKVGFFLNKQKKSWVFAVALVLIGFGLALLQGCATPEGGSSMPWARPESWEKSGSLMPGVNF